MSPESEFASTRVPDEGLDHIGVKVDRVAEKLNEFAAKGIEVVDIPESIATKHQSEKFALLIRFAKDPDGNWIGLHDHPDGLAASDPGSC